MWKARGLGAPLLRALHLAGQLRRPNKFHHTRRGNDQGAAMMQECFLILRTAVAIV